MLLSVLYLVASKNQVAIPINGFQQAHDGGHVFRLPDGSQPLVYTQLVKDETLLDPEIFSSPFWRTLSGCNSPSEFQKRYPDTVVASTGKTILGLNFFRTTPIKFNFRESRLELAQKTSANRNGFESMRFPIGSGDGDSYVTIGRERLRIGFGPWSAELIRNGDRYKTDGIDKEFATAFLNLDKFGPIPIYMQRVRFGPSATQGIGPHFACWDTMEIHGDHVTVHWDNSWSAFDRAVSLVLGIPVRYNNRTLSLFIGYKANDNFCVNPETNQPISPDEAKDYFIKRIAGLDVADQFRTQDFVRELYKLLSGSKKISVVVNYRDTDYDIEVER
ncbi:MAG: hypothetical protein SFX74_12600 [Fimbriimonadaceae bacterium]|nr:hypothetical protein [Fimbriimonadaceae bacterium]